MSSSFVKLAAVLAITVSVLGSCKTKKNIAVRRITDVPAALSAKATLINKTEANANSFSYYSATGKAKYKDQEQDVSLDVSLVMEKDRYIWMRCTALLGIEVARIRLTPDSVVILDMLHRKAIITNYEYIRRITGVTLMLGQLQDLVIGNRIFRHEETSCIADTSGTDILIAQALNTVQAVTTAYAASTFKVQRTLLIEKPSGREFSIVYSNPHNYQDNMYPAGININIRAEKNRQCEFQLTNFAFEKKKEVVFSIPKTFEIVHP